MPNGTPFINRRNDCRSSGDAFSELPQHLSRLHSVHAVTCKTCLCAVSICCLGLSCGKKRFRGTANAFRLSYANKAA
uniref:Integron gene cassette protein n=1 Tax=Steinernema glaseri TaxID=37863 RepID=A0A1I7YHL5_9BILA